jgi:hypothetical protein
MMSQGRHSVGCRCIENAAAGQSSRNWITDSSDVTPCILVDIHRRMKKSKVYFHTSNSSLKSPIEAVLLLRFKALI